MPRGNGAVVGHRAHERRAGRHPWFPARARARCALIDAITGKWLSLQRFARAPRHGLSIALLLSGSRTASFRWLLT
jgi:hypothetical protein